MKSRVIEKQTELLIAQLNKNPQSRVFSQLADTYRKEGNFAKAIEICTNGLQSHPDYVTGRIILGHCYVEQGNFQAAIQEFLAVLPYDRKNQVALKMLADIFARQQMIDKAGDLYNILHKMDPFNESLKTLAGKFSASGETEVFTILGLPLPQRNPSQQIQMDKLAADIDTYQEQTENLSGYADQHSEITSSNGFNDSEELLTGSIQQEEIGLRMDTLFNDNDDTATVNLEIPQETVNSSEDENSEKVITGDDISNRMDALFGSEKKAEESLIQTEDPIINLNSDTEEKINNYQQENSDDEMQISEPSFPNPFEQSQAQPEMYNNSDDNSIELITPPDEVQNQQIDSLSQRFSSAGEILQSDNERDEIHEFNLDNSSEKNFEGTSSITGDDFSAHIDSLIDEQPRYDENSNLISDNNADENQISLVSPNSENEDIISVENANFQAESLINDDLYSAEQNAVIESPTENELTDDTTSTARDDLQLLSDEIPEINQNIDADDITNYNNVASLDDGQVQNEANNNLISDDSNVININNDNLSGDDFVNHIDKIINGPKGTNENEISNSLISNSTSSTEKFSEDSLFPQETISGDDFSSHLEKILGDDNSENSQTQNLDDQSHSELSLEGKISNPEETISGDDFSSHIESLIPNETDLTSSNDTGDLLLESEEEQNSADTFIVDESDLNDDTRSVMKNDTDSDEILTGDDFSNHLDKVINNSSEDNQSQCNSVNDAQFEETLQFDSSMIDKIRGEINNISEVPNEDQTIHPSSRNEDLLNFENETMAFDPKELHLELNNDIVDDVNKQDDKDDSILSNELEIHNEVFEDVSQNNDLKNEIYNIENPSPNKAPKENYDDVLTEEDDKIISEMDVLVSNTSDVQDVTGEDVIDKLDTIFPEEKISINELTSSNDHFSYKNGSDSIEDSTNDSLTVKAADALVKDGEVLPGDTMSLSGEDVEKRIDDFFSAEENQSHKKESEKKDSSTDLKLNQKAKKVDATVDSSAQQTSIDERDRPYSIPDHVLTPTLADIYYQQGQLQLAAQIYTRLLGKDPENTKLMDRLEEIKIKIATEQEQSKTQQVKIDSKTTELKKSESTSKRKKISEIDRPLAGVRIKKKRNNDKLGSK